MRQTWRASDCRVGGLQVAYFEIPRYARGRRDGLLNLERVVQDRERIRKDLAYPSPHTLASGHRAGLPSGRGHYDKGRVEMLGIRVDVGS